MATGRNRGQGARFLSQFGGVQRMSKIAGAILILSGVISGHAVFTFLAQHPHIHVYEVPPDVATMIFVGIITAVGLGVLGGVFLFKND
jgi:hypothetical protein